MYHRCWSFTKRRALVNPRRACSNLVNEVSTDRRGRLSMHLILSRCLLHSSPRYRRIARKSSVLVEASFRLFASGESISFSRVCGMARLDLTNRPLRNRSLTSSLLLYPFLYLSLYPTSIGSHQGMKADRIDLDRSIQFDLVFSVLRQLGYLGYSPTFSRLFWYLEY